MSDETPIIDLCIPAHQFALACTFKFNGPTRPNINCVKIDPQGNKIVGTDGHTLGAFRAPDNALMPPDPIMVRCDDQEFLRLCMIKPKEGMEHVVFALEHDWQQDLTVTLYLFRKPEAMDLDKMVLPENLDDFTGALISRTTAILVDGEYPDWEKLIPEKVDGLDVSLCWFDPRYIMRFAAVSGWQKGVASAPLRLWLHKQNAGLAGLVETADEDFIGLIMGSMAQDEIEIFEVPGWVFE